MTTLKQRRTERRNARQLRRIMADASPAMRAELQAIAARHTALR